MSADNLPRRDISREEARRRTDAFKAHTEAWLEELVALHDDQVWWALGYADWAEYCTAEFGSIRLPKAARADAVLTLRQASLSIRDISSALGLGRGTVERELKAVPADGPQWIIGADGKYYPAASPTPEIEAGVPFGTPDLENDPAPAAQTPIEVDEPQPPDEPISIEPEPVEAETPIEVDEPLPLRPIDDPLAQLAATVTELERHTGDGIRDSGAQPFWTADNSEIDPRRFRDHRFTGGAHSLAKDLHERLYEIEGSLSCVETLRENWALMTSQQKRRYIREMENGDEHVEYEAMCKARDDERVQREREENRHRLPKLVETGQALDWQRDWLRRLETDR